MRNEKKNFYQRGWFLCLWLILFPPVALILLWTGHKRMGKGVKVLLTLLFAIVFFIWMGACAGVGADTVGEDADDPASVSQQEEDAPSDMEDAPSDAEPEDAQGDAGQSKAEASAAQDTPPAEPVTEAAEDTAVTPPEVAEPVAPVAPVQPAEPVEPAEPAAPEGGDSGGEGGDNDSGGGDAGNFDTYDNPSQQATDAQYVLNTNTLKFHHPMCKSVKKIAPQNYAVTNDARETVIAQGYSPCGNCDP